MPIWQLDITARAASCFDNVTPAQQEASTNIGTSGKAAFSRSAFDTTHMSVQRPIISIYFTRSSPLVLEYNFCTILLKLIISLTDL